MAALLLSAFVGPAALSGAQLVRALAAVVGGTVVSLLVPWQRLPAAAQALPPLLFLVFVALVRNAEGTPVTTFTPMLALPVIWFALYGTQLELGAGIAAAGLVIALPPVLDPDGTLSRELPAAGIWLVVLLLAGYATSALVRERERLLGEVAKLARTDPLTGLANRRGWGELLRREIARGERSGAPLSVALVDIDRFKDFNDRYRHGGGPAAEGGGLALERPRPRRSM